MITKRGDAILHDYQQRVLDRLKDNASRGLIAWHSTGSGKTLTALKALQEAKERTGKPGLFIVPASLVNNAKKELAQHKIPLSGSDLEIASYEKAVRDIDRLSGKNYGLIAFDEAHKLRNDATARVQGMKDLMLKADKNLFLTGTAGYNSVSDIVRLAKLINPDLRMPATEAYFEAGFVDAKSGALKNADRLKRAHGPYVDVYERPKSAEAFPETRKEVIDVPMSEKQEKIYKYLVRKLPPHLRLAVSHNLPLKAKDAGNLNAFSTGIRQVSDSTMAHDATARPNDSPKLSLAASRMAEAAKAPRFRGIAYSNYIGAGLNPYAALLREKGIEPLIFTGGMSAKAKKALVDEYNSPDEKAKALLLSSSGGEGLDLKGTRLLQILEPHFNQAKIDQVIGRGARYMSHAHLPESERNLLVEEYRSTLPKHWYNMLGIGGGMAIDSYLANASARKQKLIDGIRETLKLYGTGCAVTPERWKRKV